MYAENCKQRKIHWEFDPEVVRNLFKQQIPSGGSMKAANLKSWIASRYTDKLAGLIVNQLKGVFADFSPALSAD